MRIVVLLVGTLVLTPPVAGEGTCLDSDCHGGILDDEVVHGAALDGDCSVCHESEEGDHPVRPEEEDVGDLCAACHGDVAEEARVVHGPVKTGACTLCHDPHASPRPALLRAGENDLCAECHLPRPEEDPTRLFGSRKVDGAWLRGIRKIDLTEQGTGHPVRRHPTGGVPDPFRPGELLGCRTCHLPHGSNRRALLAGTDTASLCGPCHSKTRRRLSPPVVAEPEAEVPRP